ncbi:MAG: ComF family protein [bacterium]
MCKRNPPGFAVARSVAAYEGPLREAICALKFRRSKAVADPLARLLVQFAPREVLRGVEAVVPVPLHKDRLTQRGFNQAELLARPLAEALGVPCLADALQRVRQEAPQAELGAADRWHNVEEAFVPGGVVQGPLLLVDDVFSTGATTGACAGALLKGGAQRVAVLTVARTVLRGAPRPAVLLSHA